MRGIAAPGFGESIIAPPTCLLCFCHGVYLRTSIMSSCAAQHNCRNSLQSPSEYICIIHAMTKQGTGKTGRRKRPHVPNRKVRSVVLSQATHDRMNERRDINWSDVIESYLKVYLYDLEEYRR